MQRAERTVHLVTANKLSDGGVVYLAQDKTWTPSIDSAWIFETAEAREEWVAWGKAREADVCGCYGIDVGILADGSRLLSTRERLRADGPEKVRARLGYAQRGAA